ncbi:MAG: HAD family hydrolase [Planctomycetota bacterium]|jgi:HAD superfamily hydrolase (TIGR01509 family)
MADFLPEQPIRAVAFDLDGLIFNTEHVFAIAAEQMLSDRGLDMPAELLQRMMGRRPPEGFVIMREMLSLDDSAETLHEEARDRFLSLLDEHVEPMPGVFDMFELLESLGLPKAVATSSPRRFLDELLGRFDLAPRFDFTLTAEDVTQGKPNPEIYLTAAARHGVQPSEMLVFEDSETGSRAAAASGAFVVSVPHEHSRHHSFDVSHFVADTLKDPLIRDVLAVGREAAAMA